VRYASVLKEDEDEYWALEAKEGNQFIILDLILENLGDEDEYLGLHGGEIIDSEGYSYANGFTSRLDKPFNSGEVLPGMKRRGEVAYEVPKNAKDLKFTYNAAYTSISDAIFIFNLTES